MAFLLRGAFCKKRPSKIFAGSAGEKSVENRAGKGPVFLVLPAKNIAAHLKILFIATLKSGSHNGNQMHVSCLRCSRKGMRLDDRKISKRKRRCNHEKNKRMQALLSTAMCAAILFSNAAALRINYKYIHNVAVSSFLKVSSSLLIYILLHLFTTLLSHF